MEFGGYLPLELRAGREYYSSGEMCEVVPLNSGRVAIWYSLQQFDTVKTVHLPRYYCPTVSEYLLAQGYQLEYYLIDDHLRPLLKPSYSDDEAVILVDYFGVSSDWIKHYATSIPQVILDNCHAFFSGPLQREGAYTVYSCRKFFGVADGSYVIGQAFPHPINLSREQSHPRMVHLLKSLETGTHSAYPESVQNENYFGSQPQTMSLLTKRLLESIDYNEIEVARTRNYHILAQELAGFQRVEELPQDVPAYCYPLLCDRDIKKALVEQKIYVPTLWKHLLEPSLSGSNEYKFSKYMHCLPIDQRYTEEDMVNLACIFKQVYTSGD